MDSRPRITVPTIAISLSLSRLSSTRVYHFSPRHTLPPRFLTCGWRIVISLLIPRDSPPCYDSTMRNLLLLSTIERLRHDQALHDSSHVCKLLIANEMVGASGFEPPSSWSRTSLDQAKSVELTAFACAFPRLIWATWATKYRWPEFRLLAVAHVQITLFLERMRFWRGTAPN